MFYGGIYQSRSTHLQIFNGAETRISKYWVCSVQNTILKALALKPGHPHGGSSMARRAPAMSTQVLLSASIRCAQNVDNLGAAVYCHPIAFTSPTEVSLWKYREYYSRAVAEALVSDIFLKGESKTLHVLTNKLTLKIPRKRIYNHGHCLSQIFLRLRPCTGYQKYVYKEI